MPRKNFFKELKRRKIYRVAITYAMVAWLTVQVVSLTCSTFNAPEWIMQMIFVILIIGFPIALFLGWAYELSPEGIVRTNSVVEEDSITKHRQKYIIHNLVIGMLILLLIGQFIYTRINDKNNQSSLKFEKSIAVLPFINLNKLDELEYFSNGVTQEIIDELAKVRTFAVTAFTTTFPYKNKSLSPLQIANELDVGYLVSGSARIFGDSVRLSIELLNPHAKERIWNRTFDEPLSNAPGIQTTIAKQVALSMDVELSDGEEKALDKVSTENGEAFRLFLHAKAEVAKLSKEGFSNSRKFLKRALELDENYAQAHTLLAWSYILGNAMWYPGIGVSTKETVDLALPHIEKAIDLDSLSSDIYLVRGNLNLYYRAEIAAAKLDVDHALDINSWPKIPTNYCICTVVATYTSMGEIERAKELTKIGQQVDPGNVFIHFDRGTIYAIEGNFEKAEEELHKALLLSDIPLFNFFLGWSYYHDGKYEQALTYLEKSIKVGDYPLPLGLTYMSNLYYKLGDDKMSELFRIELEDRLNNGEPNLSLMMAMISAARGDRRGTLEWLETSYQNNDFGIGYFMNIDPVFALYKNQNDFVSLRNKMLYNQYEPL